MSEHNHSHAPNSKNGLIISIILNSGIVIAEFIGGILSGSLALLSDAIHNLSDVISLIFSFVGEKLSKKPGDKKHNFAFKRAEVIIAFVNAIALILIGFYIIYEAIGRFYLQNIEINSSLMLIVGFIGFLGNFVSIFFLFKEKEDNLNKKSAYLHLLYDTISSVIVVIGGIIIYFTGYFIIDLIASIIISIFVIKSGFQIFKSSLHILMQGVPENMDLEKIINDLKNMPGIKDIHQTHIWNIDSNDIFFSSHILALENADKDILIKDINKYLHDNYEIHHTSLQIETLNCK
ncbi:MAG: cation diffusion facilitator family transporter [Candidatus Gracilibacteria bacterium]|nr:cation diffusion facilitator family transporter [Candidatus Gracilibacteria bacterium]